MSRFPRILSEISGCPENLFLKGQELEDDFSGIAIVGTRKASTEGLLIAEKFAAVLAEAGIPIVSGLAFGIDSAAHRGCLSAHGRTVAVLAGNVNKVYPTANTALAEEIIRAGGTIVSEFEEDIPYNPEIFLRRNRIISGLSQAVIIIEAPFKSGAISTASWAAEQGREVFVVPGPVTHPNYKGSHALLRDGARLVSSPEDVLLDLGIKKRSPKITSTEDLSDNAAIILEFVSKSQFSVPIDKIISATKLEPPKVLSALTELIISELIIETPSGYAVSPKNR